MGFTRRPEETAAAAASLARAADKVDSRSAKGSLDKAGSAARARVRASSTRAAIAERRWADRARRSVPRREDWASRKGVAKATKSATRSARDMASRLTSQAPTFG